MKGKISPAIDFNHTMADTNKKSPSDKDARWGVKDENTFYFGPSPSAFRDHYFTFLE